MLIQASYSKLQHLSGYYASLNRVERDVIDDNTNTRVSLSVDFVPYTIAATRDQAVVQSVSSELWGTAGQSETVLVDVVRPQILQVNDGDIDGDGIPDFADGLNTTYPSGDDLPDMPQTASLQIVPLLPELTYYVDTSNTAAKIRFNYSASDPAAISVTTGTNGEKQYQPAAGGLRLWRLPYSDALTPDRDPTVSRDPRHVSAGGDYFAPGEWYETSIGSLIDNTFEVFCESVAVSSQLYDQAIEVEVDIDGDGPLPSYVAIKYFYTSVGLALEKVENGVIGDRDMRMRPSLPNPVINLQPVTVTNPHTSPDGSSLLVDISIAGTVTSAVCDLTPGTDTGTIQNAYASVNDEPLPQSVVPLTVTKADTAAAQDRPHPYQGTFSQTLTDVVVTEGRNTLSLGVSDPIYHLSGTAEAHFEIDATPPPALGWGAVLQQM